MVKISCPFTTSRLRRRARIRAARAAPTRRPSDRSRGRRHPAPDRPRGRCAATLTAGVSCTSTDVAVPMTRWFVAISPFASITNPDAWVVGVQRATTLSCHCGRRNEGSASSEAAARRRGSAERARPPRCRRSARGPRRGRRRCPPSASIGRPCPGTRPAGPIPRCSSPGAASRRRCHPAPVTIRRGAAVGGLSLMSSAWRGTGVAFRSASTRTTFI